MAKMIFINLPVTDLARSIAFYKAIGAEQNLDFSDETGACMVLSETIHVMILTQAKFANFTSRKIIDAHSEVQVLLCVMEDSRAGVDEVVAKAGAAGGGVDPNPPQDYGWMYGRSFDDPDGHIWEVAWMDLAAAKQAMSAA
jgi:predicted lactoylglutathione lyase